MKIASKLNNVEVFRPVTLELTFETMAEVKEFASLVNCTEIRAALRFLKPCEILNALRKNQDFGFTDEYHEFHKKVFEQKETNNEM